VINDTLIWFLLLPVIGALLIWWLLGHRKEHLPLAAVYLVASCAIVGLAFAISHGSATSDTEIWNGQITAKERKHGEYTRSYECNCTETCSGTGSTRSCTKTCMTCYEDHYTVHWYAHSTLGTFTIDSLDRTSRSVYQTPDPQRYTIIRQGEPCSKTNTYTNYVQAVPETLFKPSGETLRQRFAKLIPAYPDQVYDYYRINRFLTPGYSTPDAKLWNDSLSELLKERGPRKQVNTVVVIAKTADPNYVHALRDAWEGANKNDVVLVIGSAEWPTIDFVEVISWTKKELFKIQLRDEVLALGTIQRQPILDVLAKQIDTTFERRRMREFEYLQAEIDPPSWLLVILALLMAVGAFAIVVFSRPAPRSATAFDRVRNLLRVR